MAGKRGLAQGNGGARHRSPDRTATPLQAWLALAFDGLTPGPAERAETGAALGLVPADELCLPLDMPQVSEALCAGLAVATLDVPGAGPGAGVRRAGHYRRAGVVIARAGTCLAPRHNLIVAQAGIARIA